MQLLSPTFHQQYYSKEVTRIFFKCYIIVWQGAARHTNNKIIQMVLIIIRCFIIRLYRMKKERSNEIEPQL
jgi:hypothetical protein